MGFYWILSEAEMEGMILDLGGGGKASSIPFFLKEGILALLLFRR